MCRRREAVAFAVEKYIPILDTPVMAPYAANLPAQPQT
jgi:hypothetical protein